MAEITPASMIASSGSKPAIRGEHKVAAAANSVNPKPQGSGRKPGTPNCMTTTIKEAVVAAAEFVGEKRLKDRQIRAR
jgi:hypothetical protein